MKKLLMIFACILMLGVCVVSASAAEAPEKMEVTATPDKLVYFVDEAVQRTESVWDEQTEKVITSTYDYYPVDFAGLEITFTYANGDTKVFKFDDELSLNGSEFTIKNLTEQTSQKPWMAEKVYEVVLGYGDLKASYEVTVTEQKPDESKTVVGFDIVKYPAKRVYLQTEAFEASEFNAQGEVVKYNAYSFSTEGMLLVLTFGDGSIQYCTPAMLPALTGESMTVSYVQSAEKPWQLGANMVELRFGELVEQFDVYVDIKDHKFEKYEYNGDSTHSHVCTYCQLRSPSACEGGQASCGVQAVCTVCKHSYGITPEHMYIPGAYDTDKKQALYTCQLCSDTVYARPMGDMDFDGALTAGDAREILRYSVGLTTMTKEQITLADIEADGVIGAGDARLVLRVSVGLEKSDAFVPVTETAN